MLVADAETVAQAAHAGIGGRFDARLGNKRDPRSSHRRVTQSGPRW